MEPEKIAYADCRFLGETEPDDFETILPQLSAVFAAGENLDGSIYASCTLDAYITLGNIANAEALKKGTYLLVRREKSTDNIIWYMMTGEALELESGIAFPLLGSAFFPVSPPARWYMILRANG